MEIRVDRDLCEANARCVAVAPSIFALDDDDYLHITQPGEDVDPRLVAKAVLSCPRTALTADLPPGTEPLKGGGTGSKVSGPPRDRPDSGSQ
jgi:ferredoxin